MSTEPIEALGALSRGFRLVIEGEPVAKGRPRLTTVGGHARAFTPAKTRRYEDIVRQRATVAWGDRGLLVDGGIRMTLLFVRSIPASWPRGKRAAALAGEWVPSGRPDLDNLVKSVTDGLNGVIYTDDAMIYSLYAMKYYGDRPRVVVVLAW